jgi:cyclic 2,3-diphosphoglycerate synthetase
VEGVRTAPLNGTAELPQRAVGGTASHPIARRKRLKERSIILVDGEHYPPVTARAIAALRERGEEPVVALLVGGSEKLGQVDLDVGVPVELAIEDTEVKLAAAIDRYGVTRVIDLSDEPILGYERRSRLASVALWKRATYEGADFTFRPPQRPLLAKVPSVAIIGTGKRVGKTAIGSTTARVYSAAGLRPVVVAMGRGGPAEPQVIQAAAELTPEMLLSWVEEGRHAASDYIQDAMMAGVPTVGSWRAAGGLAGATGFSNYPKAIEAAHGLNPGMLILEEMAPSTITHYDAAILVVRGPIRPICAATSLTAYCCRT